MWFDRVEWLQNFKVGWSMTPKIFDDQIRSCFGQSVLSKMHSINGKVKKCPNCYFGTPLIVIFFYIKLKIFFVGLWRKTGIKYFPCILISAFVFVLNSSTVYPFISPSTPNMTYSKSFLHLYRGHARFFYKRTEDRVGQVFGYTVFRGI